MAVAWKNFQRGPGDILPMRLRHAGRYAVALAQLGAHRIRRGNQPLFKKDYVTPYRERWSGVLEDFRDRPARILEVGSYEGRSALFFLDALPQARITCIDTFPPKRSVRFDHNTRHYRSRINKIQGRSASILDRLAASGERYDVAYIDGSHRRSDVLADSVLAWDLLAVGGVLIWDDYLWKPELPLDMRPQQAIDLFCLAFSTCLHVLHRDYQVIARKTADWPVTPAAALPHHELA